MDGDVYRDTYKAYSVWQYCGEGGRTAWLLGKRMPILTMLPATICVFVSFCQRLVNYIQSAVSSFLLWVPQGNKFTVSDAPASFCLPYSLSH